MNLYAFSDEMINYVHLFRKEWEAKHKENPEQYPIDLPENNVGLWLEFFMVYYTDGII